MIGRNNVRAPWLSGLESSLLRCQEMAAIDFDRDTDSGTITQPHAISPSSSPKGQECWKLLKTAMWLKQDALRKALMEFGLSPFAVYRRQRKENHLRFFSFSRSHSGCGGNGWLLDDHSGTWLKQQIRHLFAFLLPFK